MSDCIFCKIVASEIPCYKVWENETHLAFLDINPVQEGHTLLIPKKHAGYLFALDDARYQNLLLQAKHLSEHLKERFETPRVGMVVEGFAVDHVHIHLIPITHAGQLDPASAKPADPDDLKKVAQRLQNT